MLCEWLDTWMFSQTMNPHKFVPYGCFMDFTRIEFNQILIKHDNDIGTRIKEMLGPSTTTDIFRIMSSFFHSPFSFLMNCFQTLFGNKMNIEVINYLILENWRKRPIMIKITSGAYQAGCGSRQGAYLILKIACCLWLKPASLEEMSSSVDNILDNHRILGKRNRKKI
jgi:hypothetical protein